MGWHVAGPGDHIESRGREGDSGVIAVCVDILWKLCVSKVHS